MQKLPLLNFEGTALLAVVSKDTYIIQDQWKQIVDVLTKDEMREFIFGERTVKDSSGKVWNYAKESDDAKPSKEVIDDLFRKRTYVFKDEARYGRTASVWFENDLVWFDNSDGEYGPSWFRIDLLKEALIKHEK